MDDIEQSKHVVVRDRWDVQDYDKARTDVSKIPDLEESLKELSWTAGRLLSDTFTSLHKAAPKVLEAEDVDRPFRVNRRVMGELMDTQPWADVRQHTVGDQFLAGLAVTKIADHLKEILERSAEAQKKQDEAEEKAQEYADACAEAGVDPGDQGAVDQRPGLRDLRSEAQRSARNADDELDRVGPTIAKAARAAAGQAADEIEELAAAAAAWGLEPGEASRMSAGERLALAQRLSTDRMKKITEMFGRLRSEMWAAQSNRWDNGPDEIADITLSDDLNRLTGSELLSLTVPELEGDFLDRWSRKQLLTFEMQSRAREAKGRTIHIEDSSGSMMGDPEIWARAVGLVLLDVAVRQNRGFTAIIFGSKGEERVFDFGPEPTVLERLEFAEFVFHGGTWFEGPLATGLQSLEEEHAATGRTTGDIVFVTDGDAPVSPEFAASWAEARQRLGFRCWGISIGYGVTTALASVCDSVTDVSKLTDGSDVKDVFGEVMKQKEAAWV